MPTTTLLIELQVLIKRLNIMDQERGIGKLAVYRLEVKAI
jgi:hypothetical protein